MNLPLVALAILCQPASSHKTAGSEIFVRTDSSVRIERLAAAVQPIGVIESREKGTHCYLIRLNPGVDDEAAKQRLEKIPGVHGLEPEEEPVDMSSMKSLNRKIAHMMEAEQEEGESKGQKGEQHHDAGLDYLRAYQYFVGQRAFPNDSYDWSLQAIAREHAHQMPATQFPNSGVHADIASPGQYWQFLGPTNLGVPPNAIDFGFGPTNGRVNAVAYDPTNAKIMYAGGAQGGLWKSTNSGSSWQWLSQSWTQLAVNCIVVDPVNPQTIYVALGDYHGGIDGSNGIMKTTDGGQTWAQIFNSDIGISSLLMDPTNDQVLIAGMGQSSLYGGVYYSSNGGGNWKQVYAAPSGDQPRWPTIASSAPSSGKVRFYAIEGGFAPSTNGVGRLIVSDDHGKTWTPQQSPVGDGTPYHQGYEIATSPTNPKTVYILDAEHQELYRSQDQGNTWVDLGPNLPTGDSVKKNYNFSQSNYDYHLECGNRVTNNVNADVLYLGLIDLQESLDEGHSWTSLGGPSWQTLAAGAITHNDQHCLAVCPTNPNLAIFSNDGGVYQLSYSASKNQNTITSLNANLANTMFYHIACHPVFSNYVMGGSQDNSTPYAQGDLGNWLNCASGDGGGCAINQTNPLIAYATSENLGITRTGNYWVNESGISPSVPKNENLPFVTPIVLDPNNQNLLYTGTNFLYRWNDSNQTWTNDLGNVDLTNDKGTPTIQAIAIAPSDSNRIYTGSSDGKLSMSTDNGSSWATLAPPVNASITSISVNPNDSGDVLIGYSGSGVKHLYKYKIASTFESYAAVTGSGATALPDTPLNAVVRDVDDPANTWYIATDVGIFQTNNGGSTWTNTSYAYGLPDVIVDDLVFVPGTRYLNAGTYGRGLWRLWMPPNGANLSKISISPTSVVGGNAATGTITLSKPAGPLGMNVDLSGNTTTTYPNAVNIPAGQSSATFQVTTKPITSNAVANFIATQQSIILTSSLNILAPTFYPFTIEPSAVLGGVVVPVSVNLTGNAPSGGVKVTLSSNNAAAKVPASVTIPAGQSQATFNITTVPLSATVHATISATPSLFGTKQTAPLEIEPPMLTGLSVSPLLVSGGSQTVVTGTLTIDGQTPPAGMVVKLFSTNTSVATVPASVTVKLTGNATTATFTVTAKKVTTAQTVTIEAEGPDGTFHTVNIGVLPIFINNLTVSPSTVNGGSSSTGTVQISAAPSSATGAVVVKLSSPSRSISFPASVSVPVGKTSQTFTIKTSAVTANTSAVISGTLGGPTLQDTLYIQAPTVTGLTISPTSVVGSSISKATGTVTISGPAPTGGVVVKLSSSSTAATVPATVTVPAGQHTATFTIKANKVLTVNIVATVTASIGASNATATLTVKP